MFYISDISNKAPNSFDTKLQEQIYATLDALNIPFSRVTTDEAITMEDCLLINQKLDMNMVKTLFLCNRQKTDFYLFITRGDKPFSSKIFSTALNISRVSFAPAELMYEMLGTKIGAATIFSSLLDKDNNINIVIDKDICNEKWYGCSDGTTTGYMKISTEDIITKFLSYVKHTHTIVEV